MLFPLHQIPTTLQFPDGNTRWLLNAIVCLVLAPVDRTSAAYPWYSILASQINHSWGNQTPFGTVNILDADSMEIALACSPKKYASKVLCISLGTEISFGRLSDQYIRPAKDLAAKIRGNVLYLCHNDQPRHSRSMHMTSKVTIHCTQTTKGNLWHRVRWPGRESLMASNSY